MSQLVAILYQYHNMLGTWKNNIFTDQDYVFLYTVHDVSSVLTSISDLKNDIGNMYRTIRQSGINILIKDRNMMELFHTSRPDSRISEYELQHCGGNLDNTRH